MKTGKGFAQLRMCYILLLIYILLFGLKYF
jgi:hypothetical protein